MLSSRLQRIVCIFNLSLASCNFLTPAKSKLETLILERLEAHNAPNHRAVGRSYEPCVCVQRSSISNLGLVTHAVFGISTWALNDGLSRLAMKPSTRPKLFPYISPSHVAILHGPHLTVSNTVTTHFPPPTTPNPHFETHETTVIVHMLMNCLKA